MLKSILSFFDSLLSKKTSTTRTTGKQSPVIRSGGSVTVTYASSSKEESPLINSKDPVQVTEDDRSPVIKADGDVEVIYPE